MLAVPQALDCIPHVTKIDGFDEITGLNVRPVPGERWRQSSQIGLILDLVTERLDVVSLGRCSTTNIIRPRSAHV
jgi:hypothetical protein